LPGTARPGTLAVGHIAILRPLSLKIAFVRPVNTPSRATLAAVCLTFARAFVSGDPYDDLVPGAEQGEVE
jgi:hypothetical protein